MPLVITMAASGLALGCGGSAPGTAVDPLETRTPTSGPVGPAPAMSPGDRLVRLADGHCELIASSGGSRRLESCPVEIVADSAAMVRRYDGDCYLDYQCGSSSGPPDPPCNPPAPDRIDCPEGSPPAGISRNPPAVSP